MGGNWSKDDLPSSNSPQSSFLSSQFGNQHSHDQHIPHEKRLAKRQIEVYFRDFFTLYHDRIREIARIENAAHQGEIDESTRRRLKREQFMRELEYIRRKRNPMSIDHYEIIRQIGKGSFGEVFLVRHRLDGQLYAMKKLQKKAMIYHRQVNHVWLERFVLASVGEHPLVVKMHYSFQDRDYLYFIMEYLHGGDMMTMLIRQSHFSEDWARFYIAELAVAIDALHRTGIIHRDIKPDNILFRKDGHICLSDFGLSKSLLQPGSQNRFGNDDSNYISTPNFIEHIRRGDIDLKVDDRVKLWKALAREVAFSRVGTPNYMAPEVLQDQSYTESCDWWSVGIILYEMLVGYPPFFSRDPNATMTMICQWRQFFHFPTELSESQLSRDAKDLIRRLVCEAPYRLGARKGLIEFKEHPFFRGIDWDNLSEMEPPFIPDLSSDTDTKYFGEEVTGVPVVQPTIRRRDVREDFQSSATSASSGSGKDEGMRPGGLGPRRRSFRVKYEKNRDLEFIGFTFIPMRSGRGDNFGSYNDLYNDRSRMLPRERPSTMTQALSLEGNAPINQVKPLRSPRGPVAEETIAAAEVVDDEGIRGNIEETTSKPEEAETISDSTRASSSNNRVRFEDGHSVARSNALHRARSVPAGSEAFSQFSAQLAQERREESETVTEEKPEITPTDTVTDDNTLDELDEAINAVRVSEVTVSRDEVMKDANLVESKSKIKPKPVPNDTESGQHLFSSLSSPEFDSNDVQANLSATPTSEANSDELLGQTPNESDGGDIERRTSHLQFPSADQSISTEDSRDIEKPPIPENTPPLRPTSSEVDLFVGAASRAINSAARELTNTPNSNVLEVIRNAKEDLSGTAANLQDCLEPAANMSIASEETTESADPSLHE